MIELTNQEARRYILAKQGLWPPRALSGRDGVLAVFERLGCVQYDPLNIVARNPDLVLQSRVAEYRATTLGELAYDDRALFDYWDKAAAYLPMSDWPSFAQRRRAFRDLHAAWRVEHAEHVAAVLDAIDADGAKCSLDFKLEHGTDGKTNWRWGPKNVAKAVLEMLWDCGELMVSRREGARRYYDLTERVLPAEVAALPELDDEREYMRWRVERRCRGVGLVGPGLGGEVWAGVKPAGDRNRAIAELVESGRMVPLRIEGDSRDYHMLAEDVARIEAANGPAPEPRAAFIAPLDSLMWSRPLVARLFGFEYVWEVYKPARDRRFGYYVLPVLFGDRFVARFDSRLDRKSGTLEVLAWHWEDGEGLGGDVRGGGSRHHGSPAGRPSDSLAGLPSGSPAGLPSDSLAEALVEFARFVGAEKVRGARGVEPSIRRLAADLAHR